MRSPLYRGWGHGLRTMSIGAPTIVAISPEAGPNSGLSSPSGQVLPHAALGPATSHEKGSSPLNHTPNNPNRHQKQHPLGTSSRATPQVPEPLTPARRPISATIHRRRAESLPSPPAQAPVKLSRDLHHPVLYPRRERIASDNGRHLENRSRPPSLSVSKSSSHPSLVTLQETTKTERDKAPDHHMRSPPGHEGSRRGFRAEQREDRTASPSSAMLRDSSSATSPQSPRSPYIKLTRPPALRRHTSHTSSDHGQLPPRRERYISSPEQTCARPSTHHNVKPSHTSKHGSSTPTAKSLSFDMQSLGNSLPTPDRDSLHASQAKQYNARKSGYIPPLSDEGYDRYSAHPAEAEDPPRPPRPSPSHAQPPLSSVQTSSHSAQYIPVGFASPTKELAWNRDGPAMKTHGVAWNRNIDDLVLPARPQGPRLIQARPPREEMVTGGGWWESGGQ